MTAGDRDREFQVAGAVQLKDRLPMSVHLNGTSRNAKADDRSDRVLLHALICQDVLIVRNLECQQGQLVGDVLLHRQPVQLLQQQVCV